MKKKEKKSFFIILQLLCSDLKHTDFTNLHGHNLVFICVFLSFRINFVFLSFCLALEYTQDFPLKTLSTVDVLFILIFIKLASKCGLKRNTSDTKPMRISATKRDSMTKNHARKLRKLTTCLALAILWSQIDHPIRKASTLFLYANEIFKICLRRIYTSQTNLCQI